MLMFKIEFQRTSHPGPGWQHLQLHNHHHLWADHVIHFHRKDILTDHREDFDHHPQWECHHQWELSGENENIHRMEGNNKTDKWEGMVMDNRIGFRSVW